MPRLLILRPLPGWLLATALLGSCGIRLPVQSVPTHHRTTARLESTPQKKPPPDPDLLVWLIADKWHTGMVIPYAWLVESGFVPPAGFGKPQAVALSWGSRSAYSKQGVDNLWKFLRVIFSPTPSVMELIPVDWNVPEVCPHQRIWRKLVRRDRGPALASFLNGCSAMAPDGTPMVVCESSWGHGVQLEGRYSYFIPRICNVWTAQAIECLGGQINPWFALTANGLIRQAEKPPNDFECVWPGCGNDPLPIDPQPSLAPPKPATTR